MAQQRQKIAFDDQVLLPPKKITFAVSVSQMNQAQDISLQIKRKPIVRVPDPRDTIANCTP